LLKTYLERHILRDPIEYPEPERFNPDRFVKDGKINPDIRDPHTFTFGFGRRYANSPRLLCSIGSLTPSK
jgi:cytochrome P450